MPNKGNGLELKQLAGVKRLPSVSQKSKKMGTIHNLRAWLEAMTEP
jgi:hypothetical protein